MCLLPVCEGSRDSFIVADGGRLLVIVINIGDTVGCVECGGFRGSRRRGEDKDLDRQVDPQNSDLWLQVTRTSKWVMALLICVPRHRKWCMILLHHIL